MLANLGDLLNINTFTIIKKDMRQLIIPTILICLLFSCAPARFVKPLNKKQHAANISLGGPLIKYGTATIPIPFLTANYGYGFDSTTTCFASINITSALYGNFQVELGATKQLLQQKKYFPALSVSPMINVVYKNKDAKKLYPQLTINAFWEYGKRKNFFYLGADNWFELSAIRQYEIKQKNHWIFMPMVGHSFARKKWNFNIEAKIIAPNISNEKLVVDYVTPVSYTHLTLPTSP
jgi:hypothetical protein